MDIPPQSRVAILIDGSNFYKNLENLGFEDLHLFDYDRFVDYLTKGREIVAKLYYKGVISKEVGSTKSEHMVASQQRLFARLISSGWEIKRGRMLKNPRIETAAGFFLQEGRSEEAMERDRAELILRLCNTYRPVIVLDQSSPLRQVLKIYRQGMPFVPFDRLQIVTSVWKEKGIDVKIALDIVDFAYSGRCGTIILVSNDSDLSPAIDKVGEINKSRHENRRVFIEYIGFQDAYSISLLQRCDAKTLLSKTEITPFLASQQRIL